MKTFKKINKEMILNDTNLRKLRAYERKGYSQKYWKFGTKQTKHCNLDKNFPNSSAKISYLLKMESKEMRKP